WNIQYMNWDFSHLKPGTLYDVYVKVKVKHAASNPSGDAFKIGVYDITDQNFTISEQTITASETEDNVWTDVKIGMFKPNASVNWLSFYVSGTANLTQISDIYVDAFIFIEHETYTIEDNLFFKFNDAAAVVDPMAVDNSNCNSSNIFDLE
ncbi:hypothetical protein ACFQZR_19370, partial [Paenibacillus sp. GCM10027629]|uniref:hypothetical protein n=1 Tax=Paenibacillus sp. GCM10027629 TaxID=3273414 RepID=UPI003640D474